MNDPAPMTHVFRWRKYRPELQGRACRVVARGARNSVLVEFADGERVVCSRWAIRKQAADPSR